MQKKFRLNGKEIDLTGDSVTVKSNYLNIDKYGNASFYDYGVGTGSLEIIDKEGIYKTSIISEVINQKGFNNHESSISAHGASFDHTIDGDANDYGISMDISDPNGQENVELFVYSAKGGSTKITPGQIITPQVKIYGAGTVMHGTAEGHKYQCNWTGSQLQFFVDVSNVGTLSDERLKTDIKEIDDDFIKAIKEVEMKQFKVANRNGLITFGILAQDLMSVFEKYNKNPFDYEIVYETQYRLDDDTIYYAINYEQFLILKAKAQEQEIKDLLEKDKQKEELIQSLIKRVEKLEEVAK